MYKTKKLLEDNYDFSSVYLDRQQQVREASDVDFDLQGVVKFLQVQTKDFTVENQIAKDLDEVIYKIVQNFESEKSPKKLEIEEAEATDEFTEEQLNDLKNTLDGMEIALDDLPEEEKEIYYILKEQYEQATSTATT